LLFLHSPSKALPRYRKSQILNLSPYFADQGLVGDFFITIHQGVNNNMLSWKFGTGLLDVIDGN
jgi:hypothetical protein